MNPDVPNDDHPAIDLSLREWLVVALLVTLLLAIAPSIPFRPKSPVVERDYRIPYALSRRYDLYRRYTTLAANQFEILLVGDSVVWGQCCRRSQTLAHHLNELTKQPRFANLGLDGMHPLALGELLEYHAPALTRKNIVVQFDPLWMIVENPDSSTRNPSLFNRPNLTPRLAAHFKAPVKQAVGASWSRLVAASPLDAWGERLADTRVDFLAWSLNHPYESPLQAISATLPPSEDSRHLRLVPWSGKASERIDELWGDPDSHGEWAAFEQLVGRLQDRGNRVLVLLGPMNEHIMSEGMRERYQGLKDVMARKLREKGVRVFVASLLSSDHYADICHPLGEGYEALARELLQKESAWLLGLKEPR